MSRPRTDSRAASAAAVRLHDEEADVVELRPVCDEAAVETIALALARWLVADLLRRPENDP
jgi:hypothetical protein